MNVNANGIILLVLGLAAITTGFLLTRKNAAEAERRGIGTFMRFTKGGLLYFAGYLLLIIGLIVTMVIAGVITN